LPPDAALAGSGAAACAAGADKVKPPALFLMGPTATGKTALAVDLATLLPCDIISVDSAQVFRGMDIGTSKPSKDIQSRAPHRLIDILDAAETYSAGRFRLDALREMQEISQRGRIPLLVGGTGLYFRSLQCGLASLPPADPQVRSRLLAVAQQRGWSFLYDRLRRLDPAAASRIHHSDGQRIERALEVYESTGRRLSELLEEQELQPLPYRPFKFALAPTDRALLGERIAARFQQMLRRGLVAEVEALRARPDLDLSKPSMRAVGYRQVWQYLDGSVKYPAMIERAIIATRQLAKRQMTWLRAEEGITWLEAPDPNPVIKMLGQLTT
jgi:tRNA dimethylallyltransferase